MKGNLLVCLHNRQKCCERSYLLLLTFAASDGVGNAVEVALVEVPAPNPVVCLLETFALAPNKHRTHKASMDFMMIARQISHKKRKLLQVKDGPTRLCSLHGI